MEQFNGISFNFCPVFCNFAQSKAKKLIIPGLAFGGTLPNVNTLGIVCLLLLTAIFAVGFTLYNKLHAKYALAGGLAALGIYIINKGRN